jgi:hypothetical protein
LIDVKLNFIGEFKRTIEKKREFLVRFVKFMFNTEIINQKYYEKWFVEKYFRERGFKTVNELIDDKYLLFRVLADQLNDCQIFFLDILNEICQYLEIDEAILDQMLVIPRLFQECEILRAFSLIYECKIIIHQMDRPIITIGENTNSLREINVLFCNSRYASLSKIIKQEIKFKLESDQKLIENYFRERGFKITNELIGDEFMCLRALSDQVYGDQKYFVDILTELCQYLGIYEATVDQGIEKSGRFQECKILKAFSLIYECKINVHQIDKEPITIGENTKSTREINILFCNNRYTSLIRFT